MASHEDSEEESEEDPELSELYQYNICWWIVIAYHIDDFFVEDEDDDEDWRRPASPLAPSPVSLDMQHMQEDLDQLMIRKYTKYEGDRIPQNFLIPRSDDLDLWAVRVKVNCN